MYYENKSGCGFNGHTGSNLLLTTLSKREQPPRGIGIGIEFGQKVCDASHEGLRTSIVDDPVPRSRNNKDG